jgi:hypothetical protein
MSEKHDKIKELWTSGMTSGHIAKEMGISRNAVMGIVHRMREAGQIAVRDIDKRMHHIRLETQRLEREKLASFEDIVRESPYEIETLVVPYEPSTPREVPLTAIPFDKLTNRSCRFVINNGPAKDFLFCGKPKTDRSYCAEHQALCYYKPVKGGRSNVNAS